MIGEIDLYGVLMPPLLVWLGMLMFIVIIWRTGRQQ